MSEKYKIKLRQGNKVRLFLDVDFQKLSNESKQSAQEALVSEQAATISAAAALVSEQNAAASAALFDDLNNIISEDADNDITLGSDGKLYSLPGGGGGGSQTIEYGTTITAAANLSRANQNFKTTLFDNASTTNLTLLLADWELGDWFVIRQFGDGRATILAENSNVNLPAWNKTIAKDMICTLNVTLL